MSFTRLLAGLVDANVAFVIVGMVAGQLHGSRITTFDLDIVYQPSDENIDRLTTYLESIDAYVKETWPNEGLASNFSRDVLLRERSLTLGTREGEIDVLHRIDGVGEYADVLACSQPILLDGERNAKLISLSALIRSKRASNREKDRLHLSELEAIEEFQQDRSSGSNLGLDT